MSDCQIEACLTPFNDGFVSLNTFVLNAFKTGFLLIGYYSECFYNLSLAVKILAFTQVAFTLCALIRLYTLKLKNPRRIKIFDDPKQNTIPWLGGTYLSLVFLFWIILVAAIQIAFDMAWLSSVSTTLIVWHVWAEFPLAIIGILLLRKTNLSWENLFKIFIGLYSGFFLNVFLVSLTSNPYIQGSLSGLAFVSDFSNPIIYAILTYRVATRVDRIRLGLIEAIFISHLLNFYLPIFFCSEPFMMALLYLIFQIVNIILTVSFSLYELRVNRNLPVPSLF